MTAQRACPPYRVRMWDGGLAVQWADETNEEWAARQQTPHAVRVVPRKVSRRQIRDGRWLTCDLPVVH